MKGNKDTGGQATNSEHRQKGHVIYTDSFMLLLWWVKFSEQHKFPPQESLNSQSSLPAKWRCVCICLEISQMHVWNGPSSHGCQRVGRARQSLMQRTSFSGQRHLQTMSGRGWGYGVGGWVRQGYFWQQDAKVCLEWNKQIRFLSTQWGYLKRHFRPSMSIFFFFNLALSACRTELIPLPHNPDTPTHPSTHTCTCTQCYFTVWLSS